MNWKHTLIIVVSILLIGMGLGYLISYNAKETRSFHQEIIDAERKAIDSLHKELATMKQERENMESQLQSLTTNIRISESNLSTKIFENIPNFNTKLTKDKFEFLRKKRRNFVFRNNLNEINNEDFINNSLNEKCFEKNFTSLLLVTEKVLGCSQ